MLDKQEVKNLLKNYLQIEKEADEIKNKHLKLAKVSISINNRKRIPQTNNYTPKKYQKPKSTKEMKVKEDIQSLKLKRQQLERDSLQFDEFNDMKKIIQNSLKSQSQNQVSNSKDQMILDDLDKAANETKLNYNKFRLEKLVTKIERLFNVRKLIYFKEVFSKLSNKKEIQQQQVQQFIEFQQFQLKCSVIKAWYNITKEIIKERKQKKEEQETKYQLEQNELALEFRSFCLKNKCFKVWARLMKKNRLTKQFEKDQENVKEKVNQFLQEMQQQIVSDLQKEKDELEKLKEEYLKVDEYDQEDVHKNEFQQEEVIQDNEPELRSEQEESLNYTDEIVQLSIQPEELDFMVSQSGQIEKLQQQEEQQLQIIPEKEKKTEYSLKENIQHQKQCKINQINEQQQLKQNPWKQNVIDDKNATKSEYEDSQQLRRPNTSSQHQQNRSIDKKKNKVASELDDKAKKRKEMSEIIKQKHEEKKKQQELQRQEQERQKQLELKQRKEEEYKRLQEKKKYEEEQKQRLIQIKFEEEYKYEIAIRHYERSLLKYQIFIPLVNNVRRQQNQLDKADKYYVNKLKQKLIALTKVELERRIEQKQYEEQIQLNIAYTHYGVILKRKVLKYLLSYIKERRDQVDRARNIRRQFLVRRVMTAWYIQLPQLRVENLQIEKKMNKIINQFRRQMLLKSYFQEFKKNVVTQISEKNQQQQKQKIWTKVNQWLSELDQKKSNNEDDDDD